MIHYVDLVRVLTREAFLRKGSTLPPLSAKRETKLLVHLASHLGKFDDVPIEHKDGNGDDGAPPVNLSVSVAHVMAMAVMRRHVSAWRARRAATAAAAAASVWSIEVVIDAHGRERSTDMLTHQAECEGCRNSEILCGRADDARASRDFQ